MNSDLVPPAISPTDVSDTGASETQTPPPTTATDPTAPAAASRRGRGRRAAAPPTDPTPTTSPATDGDARSQRSRRGAAASAASADLLVDATILAPDSSLSRSPAADTTAAPVSEGLVLPVIEGTALLLDAVGETPSEGLVLPVIERTALLLDAVGETPDAGTDDTTAPASRSRRRRGRGRAAANDTATDMAAEGATPTAGASDTAQVSADARRALLEANVLSAATDALLDAQEAQDANDTLPDDADMFGDTEGDTIPFPETVSATASGRRRRRRNRGNRTGMADASEPDAVTADDATTEFDATTDGFEGDDGVGVISPTSAAPPDDTAMEPQPDLSDLPAATIQPEPAVALSPAILRRFDHREWRRQPRQPQQSRQPFSDRPTPSVATAISEPTSSSPTPLMAATALEPAAAAYVTEPEAPAPTPVPFERPERGRRFGNRDRDRRREPSYVEPAVVAAQSGSSDPVPAEIVTEIPTAIPTISAPQQQSPAAGMGPATTTSIVEPPAATSYRSPATVAPTIEGTASASYRSPATPGATLPAAQPFGTSLPTGRGLEELLERVLAGQTALLQQQQQTLQALASSVASLQDTIERMSTVGIAAGMPRAGLFVDAPNVIYAAENARVNIDYGRMLDFLGRGREMVHSIVYAPVTEENIHRPDLQRFVAPFLGKGYKMVTKPLKRFPDGTAKGNFDIELAIDIVTMSQRLDVVILISGDSDFTRLIELIQSRGVRVEVASFASNVSWELIQMADVFIDIGRYLDEFRQV